MTSKEALENIKSRINSLSLFPKVDRKTYDESWEVIEKELETLEAYREFKDYIKQIPIGCVMFTDELYSELEQIEQCGEFCDGKN